MSRPWFILAGGGTGGHLYPGLAVADAVRRIVPDIDISVFGTARPIDVEVVGPLGYELVTQQVRPFPDRPWRWPGFVAAWRASAAAARQRFCQRRPAVVLGLGGYAAAPAVVAASRLGIPTALFNPDAQPGRANWRLARYVRAVYVQWHDTAWAFTGRLAAVHVTGRPVRPAVLSATAEQGRATFGLDPAKRTLLITGASQGAASINRACIELGGLWNQAPDWQLIHLTGKADLAAVQDAYRAAGVDPRALAYTESMPQALAAADLVISRAGASTLAELTARGVASILLPYPYDRKQHQKANAAVLSRVGAAVVIEDRRDAAANAAALRPVLEELMQSADRRRDMASKARALGRPDAAEQIARRVAALGGIGL